MAEPVPATMSAARANSDAEGAGEAPIGGDELAEGRVIGERYRLEKLLGEGGMGSVWSARHTAIGRRVALKFLRRELAKDGRLVMRFLREAQAANEVRHIHIVEVLDFGNDKGVPWLAMELLEGETLASVIEREAPMDGVRVRALAGPVVSALAAVHARGFVHRDVKPDNVFLARVPGVTELVPKLLDFGIVRGADVDEVRLTSTGATLGTPAYMSPEQAQGRRDVTPAADQYALGVMLYEMLTGGFPHPMSSFNELIVGRATQPPRAPRELRPELSPALEVVVLRALAIAPEERFESVTALLDAFDGALAADPQTARVSLPRAQAASAVDVATGPTMPSMRTPLAVSPIVPVEATRAPVPVVVSARRSRPRSVVLAVAALAVFAVFAVFAAVALSLGSRTPDRARSVVTPTPIQTAAMLAPRDAAPELVTFTFDYEPGSARIELDGTLLGEGHAAVQRPRDRARHTLTVSAPGYVPVHEVLTADENARMSGHLEALDAGAPPPVVPAGSRSRRSRHRLPSHLDRHFPGAQP